MHLLVRETRLLDDADAAVDLGQSPADLVLLSFADSDLGAAATAWTAMAEPRPTLRLANLARLRHPMSVDLYAEQVLSHARCVVIRLLGGLEYWRYGAEEVAALCRDAAIPLALLPGDGRDDARLRALSTIDGPAWDRLDALLREGGPTNLRATLILAAHLAGLAPDDGAPPQPVPSWGEYLLEPSPACGRGQGEGQGNSTAAIVFYRSHLLAGDIAPVHALAAALRARGLAPRAWFAGSLKEPAAAAGIAAALQAARPACVLNLTAFSARRDAGSPLDAADAPVLQAILAGTSRDGWAASARGLGANDLAMQVALPELDGRLLTTAIAFKAEAEPVPGLQYARTMLCPDPDGVALAADRAAGWARLAATPRAGRRIAIVLSDYPGLPGQQGYAVGLDSFASLAALLALLRDEGYDTGPEPLPDAAALAAALTGPATLWMAGPEYRIALARLDPGLQDRIRAAWGDPAGDVALPHLRLGNLLLAVQPDRGALAGRKSGYHDPDCPPCHAFAAFHLGLRDRHAMVQLGAHGALEWLPGKAAALSAACGPVALAGGLPVIYPFIANNPGEAAVAKRRLGAVTIGHLTPPLRRAGLHGTAATLERLLDEYAAADGMDRRRTTLLRSQILDEAESTGLLAESGGDRDADDALARLDAHLCDLKEMQIRDGLHVFGQPAPGRDALLAALPPGAAPALDASPAAERDALLAALDGRFVQPGPAGAPSRGRLDVLPTGRNLFALDPRTVPTPSAMTLAGKAAAELLRRHAQDHGEPLRSLVLDVWASATLRTGGEDLALALLLLGTRPVWEQASGRATGIEVTPLAVLDRPRVDVTLRISGLFRDAFPTQLALFDMAVQAVAARDEAPDWNPLAALGPAPRIYGPAPGQYGAGLEQALARSTWDDAAALAESYLAGSAASYGQGRDGTPDPAGLAARVAGAAAFLHVQDHAEADLLDAPDHAAHQGGFAAAAASLGNAPALYHADTSGAVRLRTLEEELARVVRGRAANPAWVAGQMRHGFRGAAEIARSLDSLHAFAATVPFRLDRQFDLLFDATLGDPAVSAFLAAANPAAHDGMRARLDEARRRGLWRPRRNDI